MTLADKTALMEAEDLPREPRRRFDAMLRKGTSPSLALAFLSRRVAVMGNSDRAFCELSQRSMSKMAGSNRAEILKIAHKAGIRTEGKYYNGELGRYGDPHAWVSTAEDVKTVYKLKNWGSDDGMVRHKRDDKDKPRKRTGLAPDLVNERVRSYVRQDPKLREQLRKGKKKIQDVKEMVIAKHGRKKRGD